MKRNPSSFSQNGVLAESLLTMLKELRGESTSTVSGGPKISDSINAQQLARALTSHSSEHEDEMGRALSVARYLEQNERIAAWSQKLLKSEDGRRNLKALLYIELQKK